MLTKSCTKHNISFRRNAFLIMLMASGIILRAALPVWASNNECEGHKVAFALALGGGGTRGAAHVGVLRVLEKEGLKPDLILGTSIGAVVGGLYCAGYSADELEKIIRSRSLKRSYHTIPIWLRITLVPVFFAPHLIGFSHYEGLYRGKRFASYLNGKLSGDSKLIEDLEIRFGAVVTSLNDGKAHVIDSGDFGEAIRASAAIPVLRRPVSIDGDLFVDGGISANVPVTLTRSMGADLVVAVDVDEQFSGRDLQRFKKVGSVGNRVISIILSQIDKSQIERADLVIDPDVDDITLLTTRKKHIDRAVAAGEAACRKSLPVLKELLSSKCRELKEKCPLCTEKSD